jgi:hypothetical protein
VLAFRPHHAWTGVAYATVLRQIARTAAISSTLRHRDAPPGSSFASSSPLLFPIVPVFPQPSSALSAVLEACSCRSEQKLFLVELFEFWIPRKWSSGSLFCYDTLVSVVYNKMPFVSFVNIPKLHPLCLLDWMCSIDIKYDPGNCEDGSRLTAAHPTPSCPFQYSSSQLLGVSLPRSFFVRHRVVEYQCND